MIHFPTFPDTKQTTHPSTQWTSSALSPVQFHQHSKVDEQYPGTDGSVERKGPVQPKRGATTGTRTMARSPRKRSLDRATIPLNQRTVL